MDNPMNSQNVGFPYKRTRVLFSVHTDILILILYFYAMTLMHY